MKHYKCKEGYVFTLNGEPLGKEVWTPDSIQETDLGTMSEEDYIKHLSSKEIR